MISRAVLVPHPPLLIPELVTGAAAETQQLRSAAVTAARTLSEVGRHWLAVAADPAGPVQLPSSARGTFAGYGVDVPVSLAATPSGRPVDRELPLPALIAGWLRARAGADTVDVHLLAPDLAPAECLDLGARLAAEQHATGLLVLGDGSNRHGNAAPARPDERAEPFDEALREVLAAPDPLALAGLDPELCAELGVASRSALQVLAGVARGREWTSRLLYSGAPYGVGYHVAVWDAVAP